MIVEEERAPVEEEKYAKFNTLAEYMANKKKSTLKNVARGHDEVKRVNVEAAVFVDDKIQGKMNPLKDQEIYNVGIGKNEMANLLSFQGQEEDIYVESSERRGGRGGRGAFRGSRGTRGSRPAGEGHHGARSGKQNLRMDENAFPSLA